MTHFRIRVGHSAEERKGHHVELRDHLRVLQKNWIVIAACAFLGVAAASGISIATVPKYVSTTDLYVSVRSGADSASSELVQGTSFARQAVTSYVSVVTSASVLDPVIEELDLDLTSRELARKVSASSPLNTVLIQITVTDDDPGSAAQIANAIGSNLANVVVNVLEKPEGNGDSLVRIETVQPAVAAAGPASPNSLLNIVLGLFLGLAAGIAAAVLRSTLDTRIHSAHDVATVTDKPLLGGISYDPDASRRPLVVHVDPKSPRAESFRKLRTNLQFLDIDSRPRSFVITSSAPGEGKSTTAANLAISLAETGARVVLIDGDLRLPRLAEYMGIEGAVGLTDVLIGRAELVDVLQKWGRTNLYVLPSGRVPPNPSELLGSRNMEKLLSTLMGDADYVIVDAPPVLSVTDAAVISKFTGGAILVAAAGRTTRGELSSAVTALDNIGNSLMGVVMTMLPTKGPDAYRYGTYAYGDARPLEGTNPTRRARRKSK
jgi:succinoglycan biosynthesis transport protein ExoP